MRNRNQADDLQGRGITQQVTEDGCMDSVGQEGGVRITAHCRQSCRERTHYKEK